MRIMRIFDTNVQQLKYKVLTEVAYQTWNGNESFAVFNEIANEIGNSKVLNSVVLGLFAVLFLVTYVPAVSVGVMQLFTGSAM